MKSILEFGQAKKKRKITMLTCYDYTSALILEETDIDAVLIGDSSAMVMHGAENTTFMNVEHIAWHTAAVAKAIRSKVIVADMPFMSYRKSLAQTMDAVEQLMRSGAHAIKLEGAQGNIDAITHLVESGIPVMGHLGLTPQHLHALGGFKVQGKDPAARQKLLTEAKQLQDAGCFSLVLECIPSSLAREISEKLSIPTIGVGAGPDTDGQILVWHDLLGLQKSMLPKFIKRYVNGAELFTQGINQYVQEVKECGFPTDEHSYKG